MTIQDIATAFARHIRANADHAERSKYTVCNLSTMKIEDARALADFIDAALSASELPAPEGWKLVPVDDLERSFSDPAIPNEMVVAGIDAYDRAQADLANYVSGETIDWDTLTTKQRDVLIHRAGFEVLPHRSRECRCINSNRADMQRFTDADWRAIGEVESEVGKTFFRPKRHMGAKGAEEVRKWANSPHGKYLPPEPMPDATEPEDAAPEEDFLGVRSGKCDTFGGCGS